MNRKQRTILFLVVFWAVVLGVSGVWFWRVDRQEQLNRQLIAAIKREDTPAALVALDQGADANARDEPRVPGWQRLWDLIRGQRMAKSTALSALMLLAGGQGGAVSHPRPPLKEDLQLIRTLLAHGARINEVDQHHYSSLCYALTGGKKHIARLLVEQGANVDDVSTGWSLLAIEIYKCRDTSLTQFMLEHGADCNRVAHSGSWPPLGSAVMVHDAGIVRLLLRHRADPNIKMMGTHPLEYAEQQHLTEIAKLLRDAGAKR